MAELARISSRHEQIMNWLLVNPHLSLRACADHFNLSQSWLSQVIHSDLFQAALRQRQQDVAVRVADSIPQKLRRVADVALEKLTEKMEETEDPEFLLDATDKILHRMGYAPASARNPAGSPAGMGGSVQQNNFFISAEDLHSARAFIHQPQVLPGEFTQVTPDDRA